MMLSLRAAGILRAGPATARAAQLRKLASVRAKCRPRKLSSAATSASPVPFAVAFDIDGVLVRGGNQIPGAGRVLEYLVEAQSNPNVARRVPFVFLTNGGGCMEDAKAHEMSDVFFPELPVPIRPSQVMLSHTPMKSLLPLYKDKQILALGSKDYAAVCRAYGFQHVVTVEDVLHAHPELYPFKTYHKRHDLHTDPFAAVFILHDPVDWAPEIQVLCDVFEGGRLVGENPASSGKHSHIPIYSSNSDLVFSSGYAVPRLAQGAFLAAWEAVYRACYGGKGIEINRFGKPWESSYRHAEKMLVHEARLLGLTGEDLPPHKPHEHKHYPIQRVYAVGDNPLSDVDGANRADGHHCEWVSILVETGVYKEGMPHAAKHVVADVTEAFRLILELEGYEI
ncbi:hypothetical protein NSK_000244 [Nannochloropsis salina CCMP1776]|uniref:TIGR01456 family HAD hydrolase n=1 Tax=Nannochloropsis salina CCMP1776 TaxID=1027361 RepID=A0A4D9DG11_9STRA|nr:hypothetical protein NSK_000244 [Nannochloropsis salina CCMP1776]|eukprot:TFJ88675.1 hypothetical protein NSK_000244 [Nannochloropsis salina CCMP1776]